MDFSSMLVMEAFQGSSDASSSQNESGAHIDLMNESFFQFTDTDTANAAALTSPPTYLDQLSTPLAEPDTAHNIENLASISTLSFDMQSFADVSGGHAHMHGFDLQSQNLVSEFGMT